MKSSGCYVNLRLLLSLSIFVLPVAAWAQTAWVKKETDLLSEAKTSATVRSVLAAKTEAIVAKRKGIWLQIRADGETGWVKLSALRFGESGNYRTSLSELKTGRQGAGNSVAATGVRGLEADTIALAEADYDAFNEFIGIKKDLALLNELEDIKGSREVAAVEFDPAPPPKEPVPRIRAAGENSGSKRSREIDDEF